MESLTHAARPATAARARRVTLAPMRIVAVADTPLFHGELAVLNGRTEELDA
jgi:hypothetical protein